MADCLTRECTGIYTHEHPPNSCAIERDSRVDALLGVPLVTWALTDCLPICIAHLFYSALRPRSLMRVDIFSSLLALARFLPRLSEADVSRGLGSIGTPPPHRSRLPDGFAIASRHWRLANRLALGLVV